MEPVPGASVVLFGGLAKERPYPGSTVVTTFSAGITGLVKTLAVEMAPHRVNALHPGLIGDSPKWRDVRWPRSPTPPISCSATPASTPTTCTSRGPAGHLTHWQLSLIPSGILVFRGAAAWSTGMPG
ncbi:hypothetical protein [Streptomyces chartreusis]